MYIGKVHHRWFIDKSSPQYALLKLQTTTHDLNLVPKAEGVDPSAPHYLSMQVSPGGAGTSSSRKQHYRSKDGNTPERPISVDDFLMDESTQPWSPGY